MKKKVKVIIICLFFILVIGYASISTNLVMNNHSAISQNEKDFNIYFSKVVANDTSEVNISDGTIITYSNNQLNDVGESSLIQYIIINDSSQYDADINISINIDDKYKDYINITTEDIGTSEYVRIDGKTSRKGAVRINVIKALENPNINLSITLNIKGVSRTDYAANCPFNKGQVWLFDYTGDEQVFTVPCNGSYKLETWGAQGGYSYSDTAEYRGGYGSYATGDIDLTVDSKLYINVGGRGKFCACRGQNCCGNNGGYNGGGRTLQYSEGGTYYGSGGGATHIATISGLLSSLSNSKDKVIIASGGGGGASNWAVTNYNWIGGNAGGIQGSLGYYTKQDRDTQCTGGTQTSGGYSSMARTPVDTLNSGFGYGGTSTVYGPGGGGGYYGGGSSECRSCGGSSYIGYSNLTNKNITCYDCLTSNDLNTRTLSNGCADTSPKANCSKIGNGYARLTYLEDNIENNYILLNTGGKGTLSNYIITANVGEAIGELPIPQTSYEFLGWYTSEDGGDRVTSYTIVTKDMRVLHARYQYIFEFDYTGGMQLFTAPVGGTYKLEVWGAQGGNSVDNNINHQGGYGAYAKGEISLSKGNNLYVYVGGAGKTCSRYGSTTSGTSTCPNDGGYNGGGITRQYVSTTLYGSGGGATHIATTNRGLLSSYNSYRGDVLIVASAGGGASYYSSYEARGGNAGGIQGSVATYTRLDRNVTCTGGNQTSAGTGSDTQGQGFGTGGSISRYVGPGGGSGWFGGGTSEVLSCGGSSYIGNTNLTNKQMVCYNCATSTVAATKTISNTCVDNNPISDCSKRNNGYARITIII